MSSKYWAPQHPDVNLSGWFSKAKKAMSGAVDDFNKPAKLIASNDTSNHSDYLSSIGKSAKKYLNDSTEMKTLMINKQAVLEEALHDVGKDSFKLSKSKLASAAQAGNYNAFKKGKEARRVRKKEISQHLKERTKLRKEANKEANRSTSVIATKGLLSDMYKKANTEDATKTIKSMFTGNVIKNIKNDFKDRKEFADIRQKEISNNINKKAIESDNSARLLSGTGSIKKTKKSSTRIKTGTDHIRKYNKNGNRMKKVVPEYQNRYSSYGKEEDEEKYNNQGK